MKYVTFLWIIVGFGLFIAVLKKIVRKEPFFKCSNSWADEAIHGFLTALPFLAVFGFGTNFSYYGRVAASDRLKYHIPNIDSTMVLDYRSRSMERWGNFKSTTKDGLRHWKEIELDMAGVYCETDVFENNATGQKLILRTRLPGLFRTLRATRKLQKPIRNSDGSVSDNEVALTAPQAEGLLKEWNFGFVYNKNSIAY